MEGKWGGGWQTGQCDTTHGSFPHSAPSPGPSNRISDGLIGGWHWSALEVLLGKESAELPRVEVPSKAGFRSNE